ncbi:hypothetical protein MSAN_01492200 [Mycena sanguinolenta]|uniref:Uncharacterized protein n=1 Tax=Mycena sanguinolenta TaxID=230812 RepID=A0A8H6Y7K1_9AGAR|nr:hypothetical protein MSAN_01492200 [Mycena sanguinolenta]
MSAPAPRVVYTPALLDLIRHTDQDIACWNECFPNGPPGRDSSKLNEEALAEMTPALEDGMEAHLPATADAHVEQESGVASVHVETTQGPVKEKDGLKENDGLEDDGLEPSPHIVYTAELLDLLRRKRQMVALLEKYHPNGRESVELNKEGQTSSAEDGTEAQPAPTADTHETEATPPVQEYDGLNTQEGTEAQAATVDAHLDGGYGDSG